MLIRVLGAQAQATCVPYDLRQFLGIVDDVDVAEHLERVKLRRDAGVAQRHGEGVVRVQVGDDLEPSVEGDDLALEVLAEDAGKRGRSVMG